MTRRRHLGTLLRYMRTRYWSVVIAALASSAALLSLGGALWAGITAFLRAHLNTNEILVSLMLTYVADLLVKYLVFGPWQDPQSNNFPFTVSFDDDALFPLFMNYEWLNIDGWLDGTRLNLSLLMAVAAVPRPNRPLLKPTSLNGCARRWKPCLAEPCSRCFRRSPLLIPQRAKPRIRSPALNRMFRTASILQRM